MKKLFIFLMTILSINVFSLINVNAESLFYEKEQIDGMYITRIEGNMKYYQKARLFGMTYESNKFAYCIEPNATFNPTGEYTVNGMYASNLNESQQKEIVDIAYFGYGYPGHEDIKWYAITQMMIWRVVDGYDKVYFTDGLNGPRINSYDDQINEIYNLRNNYYTIPSINNKTIDMSYNNSISITDTNGILNNYISDTNGVTINGNTLIISNLDEGNHTIHLKRREAAPRGRSLLFYNSNSSQNMMVSGNIGDIDISLNVNVVKTSIELTKIDSDTKKIVPKGEAKLSGAKYDLYNSNMEKINELIIGDDMKATLEDLDFGKYYLKENTAGKGYTLDDKTYEFEISKHNPNIKLELENKVIEKEISIHKTYGDGTDGKNEANISFDIINSNDEIIDTVTTDEFGFIKVTLPYGNYRFVQKNSTEGYRKADDFIVKVIDDENKDIYLYDYKIPVPDTYKDDYLMLRFILFILGGLYVKKKLCY